jgi:hypothetical protein
MPPLPDEPDVTVTTAVPVVPPESVASTVSIPVFDPAT